MGFLSARVKICQIHQINFELTSQFLFIFCIILHCHDTKLRCKFYAHTFSTLDKRIPSKSQFLEFRMCTSENLLNSCHFWKHKSIFLKMLHQCSVPSNITPLYFFYLWPLPSHQSPIFRLPNMLWRKFAKFLMWFLKTEAIFSSNFATVFSAIKHNSPILLLAQTLHTLLKSSPLKCKFLRFSIAQVKIRQFLFKWQVNSFSNYASFFTFITQNSPVNFKPIHFLLWIKGPHQSPNF